ncbi:MAG: DMT family transporter [Armatimonadota bacterium]|nr:DMT family transporter [Armatimonadota bacterium]
MSALAVGLIITAAFLHATWNLLIKRTGGGGAFLWLVCACSAVLYAPLALWIVARQQPVLGPIQVLFILGSAVLHLGYFTMLTRGYRLGDLSVVYPLARGTGPALSTAAAIAFFGERPTPLAIVGALLVVGGVFVLTSRPWAAARTTARARWAVTYGLLTGGLIACYTLWDKRAVSTLLIPPLLFDWGSNFGRLAFLSPLAVRRWDDVRRHWREHRLEAIGVGALSPLAYILVLTALVFTPVSYVAPAREVSIVIGTIMGTRLLAEGDGPRRLTAAAAIVLGVIALALG